MNKQTIEIDQEYISLGQLLKAADLISSGGMAKWYLSEHSVLINDEFDDRRGRKLYPGDHIQIDNEIEILIKTQNELNQ